MGVNLGAKVTLCDFYTLRGYPQKGEDRRRFGGEVRVLYSLSLLLGLQSFTYNTPSAYVEYLQRQKIGSTMSVSHAKQYTCKTICFASTTQHIGCQSITTPSKMGKTSLAEAQEIRRSGIEGGRQTQAN